VRDLGLPHGRVRYGVVATLWPGEAKELRILGVHLKSGCAAGPLSRSDEACELLSEQVPILERWIDAESERGGRFLILGDFNRRFTREHPPAHDRRGRLVAFWPEISQGPAGNARLFDATAETTYIRCHPTEHFDAYIDHIMAGMGVAARLERDSLSRLQYAETDSRGYMLSDHCPLAIEYRVEP
jgi:endonuclease/exonuclease/phosphatase family metal-dependent hydrolase